MRPAGFLHQRVVLYNNNNKDSGIALLLKVMASESQCPWDKLRDLNSSTALIGHQVAVAAQSNEAQQPTTSFLSLPAEIRLKIYTFALSISSYHILSMQALSTGEASPKSVRCFMPHRAGHGQHLYCFDTREPVSLSLLRTCRLVYHEASFMPYSGNTFKFYQDPQAYRMFMANRSLLQLQEIRSLEIISEGPRFGEKKRNDIWLNMCTTMELMTSLKHLKLALRMVCISSLKGLCSMQFFCPLHVGGFGLLRLLTSHIC